MFVVFYGYLFVIVRNQLILIDDNKDQRAKRIAGMFKNKEVNMAIRNQPLNYLYILCADGTLNLYQQELSYQLDFNDVKFCYISTYNYYTACITYDNYVYFWRAPHDWENSPSLYDLDKSNTLFKIKPDFFVVKVCVCSTFCIVLSESGDIYRYNHQQNTFNMILSGMDIIDLKFNDNKIYALARSGILFISNFLDSKSDFQLDLQFDFQFDTQLDSQFGLCEDFENVKLLSSTHEIGVLSDRGVFVYMRTSNEWHEKIWKFLHKPLEQEPVAFTIYHSKIYTLSDDYSIQSYNINNY